MKTIGVCSKDAIMRLREPQHSAYAKLTIMALGEPAICPKCASDLDLKPLTESNRACLLTCERCHTLIKVVKHA